MVDVGKVEHAPWPRRGLSSSVLVITSDVRDRGGRPRGGMAPLVIGYAVVAIALVVLLKLL